MIERFLIFFLVALLPLYTRVAVVDLGRVSKDNLFTLLAIALSSVLRPKRQLPRWVYVGAIAFCFVPVFNNENPASLIWMMQSFYFFSGAFLLLRLIESVDDALFEVIKGCFVIGAMIQTSLILFEYAFFDAYSGSMGLFGAKSKNLTVNYLSGSLMNNNLAGSYLALTSLFVFERSKLLFALCVAAMILCGSLMGPLSLMVALFYVKTNLSKAKIILPIFIVFILAPFFGAWGHDSERFLIWKGILEMFDLSHVLLGGGFGWFYDLGFKVKGTWVAQEHNEYIALVNTFGIIGAFALIWFLYDFCTNKIKDKFSEAFIIAFVCNSYGHFTMHQSTVAILFILVLSYYYSQRLKNGMEWGISN